MLHAAFNLGIYQWQQMSHFTPTVLVASQDHRCFDKEEAKNPSPFSCGRKIYVTRM